MWSKKISPERGIQFWPSAMTGQYAVPVQTATTKTRAQHIKAIFIYLIDKRYRLVSRKVNSDNDLVGKISE